MILYLRTDTAVATFGVWDEIKKGVEREVQKELGRSMAKELPGEIEKLAGDWKSLAGIVVFKGPGSFTGLRIGITTANTLAYGLDAPVVGTTGEEWLPTGVRMIQAGRNERIILPEYGGEAHITQPRK